MLDEKVKVILCTAFSEYALEGFNLDVVDFLLKPISYDRFEKAISKVIKNTTKTDNLPNIEEEYIFIKTEQKGKLIKIYFKDIDYIESMGNYVIFYQGKDKNIAYSSMRDLENILPKYMFMRVHKSYIISLPKISMIENGFVVLKEGQRISIGNTYKESFLSKMKYRLI